jgi:hypothetical protein
MCDRIPGTIRFVPGPADAFEGLPRRWCGVPPTAVPRRLTGEFILPRASPPLQSAALRDLLSNRTRPTLRSTVTREKSASLGVSSLFATSTGSSDTRTGFQLRASLRPRRSSRPRRFLPLPALRACFIPQPRAGFALQGFVPRRGAVPAFAGRCPRAVEPARPPVARSSQSRPRLQGLAPRGGCGGRGRGLASIRLRAPPGLSPPPGIRLAHRGDVFASLPPVTFTASNPPRPAFGVLPMRELAGLESDCRPARVFRPELRRPSRDAGSRPTAGRLLRIARRRPYLQSVCQARNAVGTAQERLSGVRRSSSIWTAFPAPAVDNASRVAVSGLPVSMPRKRTTTRAHHRAIRNPQVIHRRPVDSRGDRNETW